MALTHAITWKGKVWDDAYLKITNVAISDYLANLGTEEAPELVKKYKVDITARIYIDSGKADTIDMFAPWHEYNTDNSGTDIITGTDIDYADLNYTTYYRKLKLVPQLVDWKDC